MPGWWSFSVRTYTSMRSQLPALPSGPHWHPSPAWLHSSLPPGVTGGCCCRGDPQPEGLQPPEFA